MQKKSSVSKPLPHGTQVRKRLMAIYDLMYQSMGDRHWWPADSREEIIFGAILVQGVAWSNTVKALDNLRNAGLLSFPAVFEADIKEVERCVIPTRYYRMKAKKLKAFASHLMTQHKGNLSAFLAQPMTVLREELLGMYGIGPETADDIVLYAAERPSFVIDAFTKRIFHRIGICAPDVSYEDMRSWFMHHLPEEAALYNQFHALLDGVGHHYCGNTKPKCGECPLRRVCRYALSSKFPHHV